MQELWGGWTKTSHTCHSWGFMCFAFTHLLNMAMFGIHLVGRSLWLKVVSFQDIRPRKTYHGEIFGREPFGLS